MLVMLSLLLTLTPQAAPKPAIRLVELYGTYREHSTLEIQRNGVYKQTIPNCFGQENWEHVEGRWRLEGETVVFEPPIRGGYERVYPVKWGSAIFLVDEWAMPGFAAAANPKGPGLVETPFGKEKEPEEYIKISPGGEGDIFGQPQIPARFMDYYKRGPVTATVRAVFADGTLTLATKQSDRLKPKMNLAYHMNASPNGGDIYSWLNLEVEILAVGKGSVTARPVYLNGAKRAPRVGDVFTTGERMTHPWPRGVRRFEKAPG